MRYTVTADRGLNVRSGPGTNYAKVGALPQGAEVVSPDLPDGWLPVLYQGGVGWVSADYVEPVEGGKEGAVAEVAPVIYQSRLMTMFGSPRDPAPYLKTMDFREFQPDMPHIRDYLGHPWGFRIYGHEMMEAPLRQSMRLLVERNLGGEWHTYDGCLNIRRRTGGGGWSTHSWGLAIDLNAQENRYGEEPTLSAEFVECFTESGFTWGGTWRTPDGMHFQLPRVLE